MGGHELYVFHRHQHGDTSCGGLLRRHSRGHWQNEGSIQKTQCRFGQSFGDQWHCGLPRQSWRANYPASAQRHSGTLMEAHAHAPLGARTNRPLCNQGFGRIDMTASLLALNNDNANVGFLDAKDPSEVEKGEKRTSIPLSVASPTWSKTNVPYNHALTLKATLVYPDPPHEM